MKLANALSQRSELQDRIRQLEHRLNNNAQVQEGESPAEDPEELLRELEEDYTQPGGGCSPLRPAGPAGLQEGKAGHPAGLSGQRQRAGDPPHGGGNQNPEYRQRAGNAEAGGPPVQGAEGAG